jgi:hypothetical protein
MERKISNSNEILKVQKDIRIIQIGYSYPQIDEIEVQHRRKERVDQQVISKE